MKKNLICINCPRGCRLTVETGGNTVTVSGEGCPRGKRYAETELTDPRRVVTATVAAETGTRIPVRTDRPLPKKLIPELLNRLYRMKLALPVRDGEVLVADVEHTGVAVICSRGREK